MTKDRKVLYAISISIFAVLLTVFLVSIRYIELITACLTLIMAVIVRVAIKKRSTPSISSREAMILMIILGVVYVMLFYASGYKFGFYENPYFINTNNVIYTMLPMVAIIISTEVIRNTILAQKSAVASVFAFLFCLLAEILMFSSLVRAATFNGFMDLVGMRAFPAFSANIFYHYSSKRFGITPNVVFRLITTLYVFFFKLSTSMSIPMQVCIKLIFPIVMIAVLAAVFEKKKKKAIQKGRSLATVGVIISCALILSVTALISCQFRFGAMVIATDSMTGEINKGDMIIYERYEDQVIEEGQVIVFTQGEKKIVHRVVSIEHINGEVRYYTKGDANNALDADYRIGSDIVGLCDMKIAYAGYPTLLLREALGSK